MEQKFTYSDPKLLNKLVSMIDEEANAKLTATLHPDIPEFLDLVKSQPGGNYTRGDPDYEEDFVPKAKELMMPMVQLCKEHSIIPYWALVFNRENPSGPGLEYLGPYFSRRLGKEPQTTLMKPEHFVQFDRWYSIAFANFQGERINDAKVAILGFIQKGYVVTEISAQLDPQSSTHDHYYDSETCKASFHAYDGEITVYGDGELVSRIKKLSGLKNSLDDLVHARQNILK